MARRKGKMWNRKRKAQDATEKSKKTIDDRDRKHSFKAKPIDPTNAKMEAYYAYQGLHSYKRELKEDDSDFEGDVLESDEDEIDDEGADYIERLEKAVSYLDRVVVDIPESVMSFFL